MDSTTTRNGAASTARLAADRTSRWRAGPAHGSVVPVLEEDADLPQLDPSRAFRASHASRAAVLKLPTGAWTPPTFGPAAALGLGLLLLEGVLVHTVRCGTRSSGELLGAGDVLQPGGDDDPDRTVTFASTWRVERPTRLAVLDACWMARMAPYPEIVTTLAGRSLRRAGRLTETLAITQHPLLEERLMLLFWHLAERFGTVCTDGVHLNLRLTHDILSRLAGARRPSVSSALSRLQREGRLRRRDHSWILLTSPQPTQPPALT